MQESMDLLSLPLVMIENILSYLSYDEIARNRLVCSAFDDICKKMLNRGFTIIERRHAAALKHVKTQLPRRESERRYHPLAKHCDILTSLETRISMLNMTYSKFIDNGICCFIPGKVIDEIRRVLHIVESSKTPPRAHEVLQELRDISSMAIEHFDDKISPAFRKRLQEGIPLPQPRPSHAGLAPLAMRQEILRLRRRSLLHAKLSLHLASQYNNFRKRMADYRRLAWKQRRTILDMSKKQKEQDAAIADLKKRIEECDIKYSELTHTNQAAGGKAMAAANAMEVASTSAQQSRHFGSQIKLDLSVLPIGTSKRNHGMLLPNIKPRKPVIRLPSLSEDDTEPPKKIPRVQESTPSTSLADKSNQTTLAKIRGITNEIRHLAQISKTMEAKLKRPVNSEEEVNGLEPKKVKFE